MYSIRAVLRPLPTVPLIHFSLFLIWFLCLFSYPCFWEVLTFNFLYTIPALYCIHYFSPPCLLYRFLSAPVQGDVLLFLFMDASVSRYYSYYFSALIWFSLLVHSHIMCSLVVFTPVFVLLEDTFASPRAAVLAGFSNASSAYLTVFF